MIASGGRGLLAALALSSSMLWLPGGAAAATEKATWTEGIRAEIAEDWDRALRIYREALATQAEEPELWLRIADIEALRGHAAAAAAATESAASLSPGDPAMQYRLSRAYAVAGRPYLALGAVEKALELEPDDVEYLHARARLANWCERYELALETYVRILELVEDDQVAALGRARAEAWTGELDEAADHYRAYLERYPDDAASRLEYARTETWRGNYPVSHAVLEAYREEVGETEGYLDDTTRVLIGADRPNAALEILRPRLEAEPESFDLRADLSLALAAGGRPREALESLETLVRLGPGDPRTEEVHRVVRTPLRPVIVPLTDFYQDSDGVELARYGLEGGVNVAPGSRLEAGIYDAEIRADAGSGLEPLSGGERLQHSGRWLGLQQRLGHRIQLEARLGEAEVEGGADLATYRLRFGFELSDELDVSLGRERGFYLVSPRALDLGIDDTRDHLRLSWRPDFRHVVEISGANDSLSDGNERWEVVLAPRRSFLRRESFNLDLGLRAWWFGFDQDLSNGYYDPRRYESYAVTSFGYWKISDGAGLSLVLSAGVFEDDTMDGFEFGGNAAVELVTGVYGDWSLKIRASGTENARVQSGAFNAWGGGIFLTRRFGHGGSPGDPSHGEESEATREPAWEPVDLSSHIAQAHPVAERSVAAVWPPGVADARPETSTVAATAADAVPSSDEVPAAPASAAEPPADSVERPIAHDVEGPAIAAVEAAAEDVESPGAESTFPRPGERIFELQLGLFHIESNARAQIEDLHARGHRPYIVEVTSSKGETRYTVRLGPYASMDDAAAMAAEIRDAEDLATVIRYRPAPEPAG